MKLFQRPKHTKRTIPYNGNNSGASPPCMPLLSLGGSLIRTRQEKKRKSAYGFIFFMGAALGMATTMFNLFPELFALKLVAVLNNADPKMVLVTILVVSAFRSLSISSIVNRYGLWRSFWVSLAMVLVSS